MLSGAQDRSAFRAPILDLVYTRLGGVAHKADLVLIDSALRATSTDPDQRITYFLRRTRCEQLYYQGLLDESMVEAERARRIALELKDSALIASSLNQVAVLMEERNDNVQGIVLLKEALRWYPNHIGHIYPLATPYRIQGNLGLCWAKIGEIDSALTCQKRSLELARGAHAPRGEALALLKLGHLEKLRTRTDSALLLFDRSIAVANANGIRDVLLEALSAKAETYAQEGRVNEMEAILTKAHTVMNAHGDIAPRSVLSFLKSEMHSLARVGQYENALASARSWRTLDRSMRSAAARTAQSILQEMHDTDADLADEYDRAAITAAELKAEGRIRMILMIGGTLAVILLVALVIIFILRSREKARIARLSVIQAEQERQITELLIRQQVAEDLHDDLGAGLSALKLNSELAADLSIDTNDRLRARTLATIAGNLITSMRHILWSLSGNDRSIDDVFTYVADRARAFCAEHDRTISIHRNNDLPMITTDTEVRHLAWPVVNEALSALVSSDAYGTLLLELGWNEGISITVSSPDGTNATLRSHFAEKIAAQHPLVTRVGGWLRTSTEGPVRLDAFLPGSKQPDMSNTVKRAMPRNIGVALQAISIISALSVSGQGSSTYRHAELDRLFSEAAMNEPAAVRINALSAAIASAEPLLDDRLTYHLLMERTKQMYYQGLYDMGIADVNRSLELARGMNDSLLIATTYNMIGLLNENLNNDAITLPWFRKAALWLPRDTECPYPVVKDYHINGNIAQCLLNLSNLDRAEYHFIRSRDQARSDSNLRALALANIGLARTYLANGTTNVVEQYIDSAQIQAKRCGSYDVYVDAIPVRAKYILGTQGEAAANKVLEEGLAYLRTDTTIHRSSLRKYFEQSSLLRVALGQYKEAYAAWFKWQYLDSAIRAADDQAALATLRIMLDNGQRLERERQTRERDQAQLTIDRSLRSTILSTTAIMALLLLGVFALLVNRQRNKRNTVTLELERINGRKELAQLRTRQRLSEEMLAELGTSLEALRIRSQLSITAIQGSEDRERMVHIASQATELITGLKQIVWALDNGRSTLKETIGFTAHYASTYCAQQGLRLNLDVPEDLPHQQLSTVERRNIFLVVKEALHNVVKHARATEVGLHITCTDLLAVRITDDGKGNSNVSARSEGNGVRNMRKRVEAIGGKIDTTANKGMMIHFTVPLSDNNGSTNGSGT